MGSYFGSGKKKLSDFTVFEMVAIFKEMDTDGDGNLSLEECLNYWQEHFPMTNSNKMMNEIDTNGDGVVSYDEWHAFWEYLLNNGYSDEQIVSELHKIRDNKEWVKQGK